MSTRQIPESQLYTGTVWFDREGTTGEHPSDPAYKHYADAVASVDWNEGISLERQDGLGTADPVAHRASYDPSLEVVYWLQQAVVDATDDPLDAVADAMLRDADETIENTHHTRIEEDRSGSDPDDPSNASGAKVVVVGIGGHPNATVEEDDDLGLIQVTIDYSNIEKVRAYEIFQPPGDESLDIQSDNSNDTTQTLTIEDDTGTSEDVSLNGTTTVTTTKSDWSSIRALDLDGETEGDVTVDLTTSGDTLATIRGSAYYHPADGTLEGDRGPPAVGSGSEATALNNEYDSFLGATLTRDGSSFNYDIAEIGMEFDNQYDTNDRQDSYRQRYAEGNRDATAEFGMRGWGAGPQWADEAGGHTEQDVVLQTAKTKWTFNSAVVTETDDNTRSSDEAFTDYNVVFQDSANAGIAITQP